MLMWFSKSKKRSNEYKLAIKKESKKGHLIEQCDAELWYVLFPQTLDEFREQSGGVVCLHKTGRGRVCKANLFYDRDKDTMEICDLKTDPRERRKGYASTILKHVYTICRDLKVKSIIGSLAQVDSNHFGDLERFYKKRGFEVFINKNRLSGKIIHRLRYR